ncbi:MAG: hypothetical protein KJ792_12110 [Actinobacteria bacterium]|nr:hypothetical protein [Actinomycetota bacterium]MCG2802054.1 hypothetical protein [Cellulomonas sp.]
MRRLPPRALALVGIVTAVVVGVGGYVWWAARAHQAASGAAPSVASTSLESVLAGPHILFRNTLPGAQYGLVAAVPLADPTGARAFTDVACDRLYHAGDYTSCLRTVRGVATTFEADLLDSHWQSVQTWPLPGIPSRTRLSDDGTLVATTAFVTGHSYAQIGFSTETKIHGTDGTDLGDLESWTFLVDGTPFTTADRNFWGVSFIDDDTFYVSAASQSAGKTWIATGKISTRTISTLREGGECPSVSPDRSKVAYKKVQRVQDGQKVWAYAVLDVGSGTETLYPVTEGCDDQIEWLDDTTILYGMPRADEPATTDLWSLDIATPGAEPQLFIEGAWSPSVVRSGS